MLILQIVEAKDCVPLQDARVDVWHADGLGLYSGYAGQDTGSAKGETFLRGTQFSGADGDVRFNTIYPGWYPGRTPHIHFKAFIDNRNVITGQLYFPDHITEQVYATTPPYRERKRELQCQRLHFCEAGRSRHNCRSEAGEWLLSREPRHRHSPKSMKRCQRDVCEPAPLHGG